MNSPQIVPVKPPPVKSVDPETGREILTYQDGAVKFADNGHWRKGPDITPITQDPRGMLARRNEKSRQIAMEAIDEGAGLDASQWGTGEGWRRIIAHTVRTYLDSKNIRGMGEVLTKLATVSGLLTLEGEEDAGDKVSLEGLRGLVHEIAELARIEAGKAQAE